MKIVTILGSPKINGNTNQVLSAFEKMAGDHHRIERVNISQHEVNGCLGCTKCLASPNEPGCVQDDDAVAIFEKMIQADAYIMATPLYCSSFTAQMTALINRAFCLVTNRKTPEQSSLIEGTRVALLVTCAGPVEDNCDAIQIMHNANAGFQKLDNRGVFILPFCTVPEAIGDTAEGLAAEMLEAVTR